MSLPEKLPEPTTTYLKGQVAGPALLKGAPAPAAAAPAEPEKKQKVFIKTRGSK